MEHLRDEGLIRFVPINEDERAVVLTEDGRDLLEANRRERDENDERQEFHAGVSHPRELEHDSELFEAYLAVEARLRDEGADIERVCLEVDLRRDTRSGFRSTTRAIQTATVGRIATRARSKAIRNGQ